MNDIKSEIKHKLQVPFEYADGGTNKQAKELIIKAPTNVLEADIIKIEEHLGRIDNKMQEMLFSKLDFKNLSQQQKDLEKQELSKKKKTNEEEDIKQMLNSLRSVEGLKDSLFAFKSILAKTCLVDGKEPLTATLYDRLNPTDTKYLLAKYIVNFIGASLLN